MSNDLHAEVDRLRKDLSELRTDINDLVRMLRDTGGEAADNWRDNLRQEFRNRSEQLRREAENLRARGAQGVEQFEDGVGRHPYSSLVTAFGVGFILSKLLDAGTHRH